MRVSTLKIPTGKDGYDIRDSRLCDGDALHAGLELAKWIALMAMAVDHYGKIVDQDLFVQTHAIGRLAFPLFAAIVGVRLALRPELGPRYLKYLLSWALLSQPAFVLAGRDWGDGNILFTLLLGVLAAMTLHRLQEQGSWSALPVLAVIGCLAMWVDYGPHGVVMVPAISLLAARMPRFGLFWAVGLLGIAANLVPQAPYLQTADLIALLAGPLLLLSLKADLRLPRLPTAFFYAFYPAHLLALHFFDLYG